MPFCTDCGNQEPEGAAFCSSCGQPIITPFIAIPTLQQQNTPAQVVPLPKHPVHMPDLTHQQEPVSEIEEKRSVIQGPGKTEPRHDREYRQKQQRWRWRNGRSTVLHGGIGLMARGILILMIVVGAVIGGIKVFPYVFHFSSNSTPSLPGATVTATTISGSGSKDPRNIEAALAPYVGVWGHHDYGLTINANGTGKDKEYFGFACDNGNRACGRTGTLSFTPISGAIIGTYTSVSYDPGLPLTVYDMRVGDSFRLALAPHDRLILTWLRGQSSFGSMSMSLCGPNTPLKFWDCGA